MQDFRLRFTLLLLGASILALASCSKDTPSGDNCAGGEILIDGACRMLCNSNDSCDTGMICNTQGYCEDADVLPPEISSVDSDGIEDGVAPYGAHRVGGSLVISGNHLESCVVDLQARSTDLGSFEDLEIVSASATGIVAALPIEIDLSPLNEQAFRLVVTNAAGSAQVDLTLLRGTDGTDLTGVEIIERIDSARAAGSTLSADQVGDFDEAALLNMASRLTDSEASLATAESDVASLENRAAAIESDLAALQAGSRWLCPGTIRRGVCMTDYRNALDANWSTAVNACTDQGSDLCTTAQYVAIREGGGWSTDNATPFYSDRAVWSADFSDNDGNSTTYKERFLRGADDPTITNLYGYACCQNITPEPFRSRVTLYEPTGSTTGSGVLTTYVHTITDTTFPAAANVCASMGSDLCTKSQYITLNDNNVFGANPSLLWTNEMSDNDLNLFDSILGTAVVDTPTWGTLMAYACCASQRPVDNSCPGDAARGVCTLDIQDTAMVNFFDAARACTSLGADICSKSQMTVLRFGSYTATTASWTNDGGDNDLNRSGGLVSTQPNNPNPNTDYMGYACCL